MTLDEHIHKAEEDAKMAEFDTVWGMGNYFIDRTKALEYAKECRQLAEWLKDYKRLLEQEPCEDAISRQAVLEAIDVKAWEFCDYLISKNRNDEQKPVSHFADNLRECVREELPSVNPQERTGHWEWVQYDSNPNIGNWHCSECRTIISHMPEETDNTPIYKWCPMCSAKMVEPQERSEE